MNYKEFLENIEKEQDKYGSHAALGYIRGVITTLAKNIENKPSLPLKKNEKSQARAGTSKKLPKQNLQNDILLILTGLDAPISTKDIASQLSGVRYNTIFLKLKAMEKNGVVKSSKKPKTKAKFWKLNYGAKIKTMSGGYNL
ncbi:hypothetical protein [Candidatus Lokiarchaeum ossiferum]|uniref:hypothetical protein n=1 Tax=Candidatus Lokiarchaeum ossiferum TaxID=2951803 RepID=UPI00352F27D6